MVGVGHFMRVRMRRVGPCGVQIWRVDVMQRIGGIVSAVGSRIPPPAPICRNPLRDVMRR